MRKAGLRGEPIGAIETESLGIQVLSEYAAVSSFFRSGACLYK